VAPSSRKGSTAIEERSVGTRPSARARARRGRLEQRAKDAERARNVLDRLLAQRLPRDRELVGDLLVDGVRYADAAGVGERFDTSRYVHRVAVDPLAVHDDLPEVDADAEVEPAVVRQTGVTLAENALDLDRARHGVADARKLRQQVVAGGVHDASVEAHDGVSHRGPVSGDGLDRADLVRAHEPAIPFGVGREHGGEPAGDADHGRLVIPIIDHGAIHGSLPPMWTGL
jgi:hypothetical protein